MARKMARSTVILELFVGGTRFLAVGGGISLRVGVGEAVYGWVWGGKFTVGCGGRSLRVGVGEAVSF